jgi:hypothetical protein
VIDRTSSGGVPRWVACSRGRAPSLTRKLGSNARRANTDEVDGLGTAFIGGMYMGTALTREGARESVPRMLAIYERINNR